MSEVSQNLRTCDGCGGPVPDGRRLCGRDTGDAFCQAPEDYPHGYDLGIERALDPARMDTDEAIDAIDAGLAALRRIITEMGAASMRAELREILDAMRAIERRLADLIDGLSGTEGMSTGVDAPEGTHQTRTPDEGVQTVDAPWGDTGSGPGWPS